MPSEPLFYPHKPKSALPNKNFTQPPSTSMFFEFFKAQVARIVAVVKPISNLFYYNRMNIRLPILPLAVLIRKHDRTTTAFFLAVVETFVCLGLIATYGIHGAIALTVPVMEARVRTIARAAFVYALRLLSRLATRTLAYLQHTVAAQVAFQYINPALCLIRVVHLILALFLGKDYIHSIIALIKPLPCCACRYVGRNGKKKIFYPCRRKLQNLMNVYPLIGFMCDVLYNAFAIMLFFTSVIIAFAFVYALDVDAVRKDVIGVKGITPVHLKKKQEKQDKKKPGVRHVKVSDFSRSAVSLKHYVGAPKVKVASRALYSGFENGFAVKEEVKSEKAEGPERARSAVPLAQEFGVPKVKVPNQKTGVTLVSAPFVRRGLEASIHAPSRCHVRLSDV
ncbi:hypothetical protein CPC08DRAFT_762304 [Agrocybe pediades]|nr:hypothetical protein CPC08DRAFT_762304 [Agrocybe pediades]